MISPAEFLTKTKDVKFTDFIHFFLFPIAFVCAFFLKQKRPDIWLICEDRYEARDNGYWFYKYVTEKHPEKYVVYAIDKKSVDYKKVEILGKVIQFGGFVHWIYYLAANKNISSQKGGNPNAAVCYFLEINGLITNNRIFLQHGVTKDDCRWLYYEVTKFNLFICGAKPEFDYVSKRFHYPENVVKYLGLSRFDNLHGKKPNEKYILVIPTWRNWLIMKSKAINGKIESFTSSEYFVKWNDFINSSELNDLAEKYDLQILFYPHRNMQKHINCFSSDNKRLKIINAKECDIQDILISSALMITDYSSVFFDFIYMKKPVVFYQFDLSQFRKTQYQQGYFDYSNNPFGLSYSNKEDVFAEMENIISNKYTLSDEFLCAHSEYFEYYDDNNSLRIYDEIQNMNK